MEHNFKILVVDDEPHIRKYLGIILKRFGAPTLIDATNGIEALALYDQHQPDLVFLDINMPMMDGMEALRQLVSRHPGARVVMLTSVATRHAVHRSFDLGAVDFLRKDIPREAMNEMLSDIIRRHVPEPAAAAGADGAFGTATTGPLQTNEGLVMAIDRQPNGAA